MSGRDRTAGEIADLIERFLSHRLRYPQEWNDFTECSLRNCKLDVLRKRCEILSAALQTDRKSLDLNRDDRWGDAIKDLNTIAAQLRDCEKNEGK